METPLEPVEPKVPVPYAGAPGPGITEQVCRRCQARVWPDTPICPECGGSMAPACIGCGYDLAGLSRDRVCPECGTPVEKSYQPDLLRNRSPGYLWQLKSGLAFVLNGLLCWVAILALSIVGAIGLQFLAPGIAQSLPIGVDFAFVLCSLLMLFGWWQITTPDPGRVTSGRDVRPRRIIRWSLAIQAVTAVADLLFKSLIGATPNLRTPDGQAMLAITLIASGAWIVQFFAAMLYVRWLARRVPDSKLEADAKRFMWLGPVLFVVLYLCLGIGPLIAMVLYWRMLNTLRKHVTNMLQQISLDAAIAESL